MDQFSVSQESYSQHPIGRLLSGQTPTLSSLPPEKQADLVKAHLEENLKKGLIDDTLFKKALSQLDETSLHFGIVRGEGEQYTNLEKGKRAVIGEVRVWSGERFERTKDGWKYLGKESKGKSDDKDKTETKESVYERALKEGQSEKMARQTAEKWKSERSGGNKEEPKYSVFVSGGDAGLIEDAADMHDGVYGNHGTGGSTYNFSSPKQAQKFVQYLKDKKIKAGPVIDSETSEPYKEEKKKESTTKTVPTPSGDFQKVDAKTGKAVTLSGYSKGDTVTHNGKDAKIVTIHPTGKILLDSGDTVSPMVLEKKEKTEPKAL